MSTDIKVFHPVSPCPAWFGHGLTTSQSVTILRIDFAWESQMSEETKLDEKQEAILNAEEHRINIDRVIGAIRPALQRDGGDCEVVDVSPDGKVVYMRLRGACSHCPSAVYTLKFGIEATLCEMVPGVERVEQVM